jgi:hypothetical protein
MSKFVVYTPEHKDYLVGGANAPEGEGSGWNCDIHQARKFRTFAQAQSAAKHIANQMHNHTEPYTLQIREVKEKNGKLKEKFVCDVPPDPDRTAWYRDNPANVTKMKELPAKLDPEIAPVTYVLYRGSTDDYLAQVEDQGELEQTGWSLHPEIAIRYATIEEAEQMAAYLVTANGYVLTLCELHETEKQVWSKPLRDCGPNPSNLGISLN